jgi:Zn-dependent protease with chaperone function
MVPGAIDLAAEALAHGVVATFVVELVIRLVPVEAPAARFHYRLAALAAPLVAPVGFALAAPFRGAPWFMDATLFSSVRWQAFRLGPIGVRDAALAAGLAAGAVLLGRDLVRLLRHVRDERRHEAAAARLDPPPTARAIVEELSDTLGIRTPALLVVDHDAHDLHCRGWRRPLVVVSKTTLGALEADELRAALAHELAHIAHRDVLRAWVLLALRALQVFNPLAQAVGRRAAHELEWRADDRAAALTGAPLALARGLIRAARGRRDDFLGISGRGRFRALEVRCRRLLSTSPAPDAACRAEASLLWGGLLALLFFVR